MLSRFKEAELRDKFFEEACLLSYRHLYSSLSDRTREYVRENYRGRPTHQKHSAIMELYLDYKVLAYEDLHSWEEDEDR